MCHLDAWMRLSNILQSYALQLSFNPRGSFCCNHDCKSCLTTMLIKQTVLHHPPILVGLMHTCTNGMGCTLTKDSCAIHVNRLGAIFAHHKNPSGVFEEPDDLLDLILSPEWTYFWTKVILYSHCHNLFWDYNLHEKKQDLIENANSLKVRKLQVWSCSYFHVMNTWGSRIHLCCHFWL